MTEYDFSPEAYEHHLRTQARIARWVDQTESYRREFGPEACQLVDPHWAPHRRVESAYDSRPRPHRTLTGSSVTSSEDAYAQHPLSPGPMPVMHHPPLALHQPTPRRPKTHAQSSSYGKPIYLHSPPMSPPTQAYPYGYNAMTGQVTSPGNTTTQSTAGSYMPATAAMYSMAPPPGYRAPYTAPASTYPIYAPPSTEKPMHPSSTAQLQHPPYSSPPTIYPLTSSMAAPYGGGSSNYYLSSAPQEQNAKPVFYQKIFKDKRSKSGRSR